MWKLGLLVQLQEEYADELSIKLVKSAENIADSLTRVPLKYMHDAKMDTVVAAGCSALEQDVLAVHNKHHFSCFALLLLVVTNHYYSIRFYMIAICTLVDHDPKLHA